jgi:hypothetical protein
VVLLGKLSTGLIPLESYSRFYVGLKVDFGHYVVPQIKNKVIDNPTTISPFVLLTLTSSTSRHRIIINLPINFYLPRLMSATLGHHIAEITSKSTFTT